jgi:hypothetical protein
MNPQLALTLVGAFAVVSLLAKQAASSLAPFSVFKNITSDSIAFYTTLVMFFAVVLLCECLHGYAHKKEKA